MTDIVVTESGKLRKVSDLAVAEKIIRMKKEKDVWEVIDTLIKVWARHAPDDVEAMRINIAEYRDNLIDKKFGQTKGGKDQERRFQLAFPQSLMMMIRSIYQSDELQMDRKFFAEFGKRYPFFRVAEQD